MKEYKEDVRIDEQSLDVEWLNQAELMLKYAGIRSQCRFDYDEAKEELEIKYAELDKEIRSNPDEFGVAKITDKVVHNTILLQEEYQDGMKDVRRAKYELDMAGAAVDAISHKKSSLEKLVYLHGQQYFAGPKVPRNLTEIRVEKQKTSDQKIAEKLQLKRKK